ncbi:MULTISPECIES: type II toxin-antitoxin system VapB family antitoxin [Microbacterium]|uniref:type II toxin-antitoxin system VapB family antitoxin n=1 Tax=Microbacterium TaxID=33882 RepID=UPI00051A7AC7|nr:MULTISPECIES: type II toxin-antitoxin system VapB family antitoxin [Microbacterium]MCE7482697.1 type II toxin-antitoxin system VapB family antitoxin [Microbacterium profundi]
MSLNIKNERVHELAREAARVTGTTQTSAIEAALRLLLQQHGEDPDNNARAGRMQRLLAMGARYRREESTAAAGVTRVEDLYDETTGLPR